jgi:hypothetical protein
MSSHAEQVPYDIVDGKKALGLCSRFETAHVTLASPRGLVGRLQHGCWRSGWCHAQPTA